MNHYPHHIGDYAKDTMGLSQGEHGAYRLLMDASYATETGIPADEVYAIARAHAAAERKNTDRVLAKFFRLRDGRWYQKRIEEEIAAYREKSEKASQSAQTRWSNRIQSADANAMRTHEERIENASPSAMLAINQEPITKKLLRRASRLPTDWKLTSEQIEWALGAQPSWDAERVLRVGEKFRDYWTAKAGRDAAKLDWDATWRNWVRNEPAAKSAKPEAPFIGAAL